MRRHVSLLFLFVLLSQVIFFTGCSSTPEAETEAPVTESSASAVVTDTVESVLNDEAAAQEALLAAETAGLMAELTAARELAVASGADSLFPEEFAKVSAEYDALIKAQQENPDADYRSQIENLRDTYLALAKLSQATEMRERIVDAGLQDSDPANFQKGDAALEQVQLLYNEGAAGSQLVEHATIAYDSYFAILSANYDTMCQSQRELALAAKEKADSIKSAMAAKDEYAAAALVLSGAEAAYAGKVYDKAYDGFVEATKQFTAVYDDVFVRRATAEEAIRRAKQKVNASAALAEEADEIAPLQDETTNETLGEGDEL
ncbi:MAG: hypothetical protein U0I22_05490 [Treponema sp.]|nr:hypothetical protein [Treponema sp.]